MCSIYVDIGKNCQGRENDFFLQFHVHISQP